MDLVLERASSGVAFLRAPVLGDVPHGFSTRIGGVSVHESTASLNLGLGFADDAQTVRRNLSLLGEAVGFDANRVVSLRQIHSTLVRAVTVSDAGLGYARPTDECADGYVTRERGVVLGVRTADCVPILLSALDARGKPYAVGALHAGWRGTVKGIATEGVRQMRALGARVEDIRVAVGPAIGACCFEIGDDVYDAFLSELGKKICMETVKPSKNAGKWRADLQKINRILLLEAGVSEQNIVCCPLCTKCRKDLFYSHRRDNLTRGSMLGVIGLP